MMGPANARQCKAARALLGWSQYDLARAAGLGASTIADYERGKREPHADSYEAMMRAFETAGIAFSLAGVWQK